MKSLYFLINAGALCVPVIFTFHRKIRFHRHWRSALPAIGIVGAFFIAWDAWCSANGIWEFNPRYLLGPTALGLPLEEIAFFFCIPYACLFTYFCLTRSFGLAAPERAARPIALLAGFVLTCTAVANVERHYTFVICGITAFTLVTAAITRRVKTLARFLPTYVVLLVPFTIVNGLLTGAFIPEEVVRYNDGENLGIRIGTIPVEDSVYAFIHIYFVAALFEWFERRRTG